MKLSISMLKTVFYYIHNSNSNPNPKKLTFLSKRGEIIIGNIEN